MNISANSTVNIAKVCVGFATYKVQLPDTTLNSNMSQLVVDLSGHLTNIVTPEFHIKAVI